MYYAIEQYSKATYQFRTRAIRDAWVAAPADPSRELRAALTAREARQYPGEPTGFLPWAEPLILEGRI